MSDMKMCICACVSVSVPGTQAAQMPVCSEGAKQEPDRDWGPGVRPISESQTKASPGPLSLS